MKSSPLTHPRWQSTVFSIDGVAYQWLDVFLAAMLRGDWRSFERQLLEGVACVDEARRERVWPREDDIHGASTKFRYDHDLLTSEELMTWLARHGLTFEGWREFFARQLLRQVRRGRAGAPLALAPDNVSEDAFVAEGVCSGAFDRLATMLAGRAASAPPRAQGDALLPPSHTDAQITRVFADHDCWLDGVDAADLARRLAHLSGLQSAFDEVAASAVTSDRAIVAQITRHLVEWTRVDLERLSFASAGPAREAALCVREDGLSLDDVAIETHRSVRESRTLLEDVEPDLRDAVLSAQPDTLVGPIAIDGRWELVWVAEKSPAHASDPLVRARAERAVVDQLLATAILTRVRWAKADG